MARRLPFVPSIILENRVLSASTANRQGNRMNAVRINSSPFKGEELAFMRLPVARGPIQHNRALANPQRA